jgi:hypothetical protein
LGLRDITNAIAKLSDDFSVAENNAGPSKGNSMPEQELALLKALLRKFRKSQENSSNAEKSQKQAANEGKLTDFAKITTEI